MPSKITNKQKKYPTMNELLEMGYTKPGAMILDEMIEAEELAKQEMELEICNEKTSFKEMDEFLAGLRKKNGQTKY